MGLADIKKRHRRVIGERLRSARRAAGYVRQEDFGDVIGADRVTVSRWEAGSSGIGVDFHEAIKKSLNVDDSFFDPVNNPEIEDLRAINRSLLARVKVLEAQLNVRPPLPPSPPRGSIKSNKPIKRR